MDQLSVLHQQIDVLVKYNEQLKKRLKSLEGEPNCEHEFLKRPDVVYLSYPIKYQYRCRKCGFIKVDI